MTRYSIVLVLLIALVALCILACLEKTGATVKAQFLPCTDPPSSERVINIHAPDPDISMLDASQLYGPLTGAIDLGKGKGIIVGECDGMDADPEYAAVGRCLTVGDDAYPADLLFRQEQPDTDTWFSFRFSPEVPDTQFIGVHSRYVADNDRVMLRIHPNRIMIRNIHGVEYFYEKEYTFDRGCWYDVRMRPMVLNHTPVACMCGLCVIRKRRKWTGARWTTPTPRLPLPPGPVPWARQPTNIPLSALAGRPPTPPIACKYAFSASGHIRRLVPARPTHCL